MVSVTYKNFIECTYFDVKHYGYRNHSLGQKKAISWNQAKKKRKTTLIIGKITSDSKWKMLDEHYNSIEYLHNT